MAGKPQKRPMDAQSDSAHPRLGSPQCTENMSLTDNNGSVTVTIPAAAVKFLGYDVGEQRRVEVYNDGVFIPSEAPSDE